MKLMMLRGLPASGKSTWAREFILKQPNGTWKRTNKDELRAMVDVGRWSKKNEEMVLGIRDHIIEKSLHLKINVIVDDTHFASKHEARLRQLAAKFGAEFEIKDFEADVYECIERDAKRANGVGKDVIWRMWKDHVIPKVEWPKNRKELLSVIISDIDGTLADIRDRSPYDTAKCGDDGIHEIVRQQVERASGLPFRSLILVSGRSEEFREHTEKWLEAHGIHPLAIFMRKAGDTRKDWLVKYEILRDCIAQKYDPIAVFDDRDQVVAMWRAQGLRVFQVADGDF